MTFFVNASKEHSPSQIAYLLKKCILHHPGQWSDLVFLCIGTDRMTGDCLDLTPQGIKPVGKTEHVCLRNSGTPGSRPESWKSIKDSESRASKRPDYCHRRLSRTKKAPGVCDHRKWSTLPRRRSSKGAPPCRRYSYHRYRKYRRYSGTAYALHYQTLHCDLWTDHHTGNPSAAVCVKCRTASEAGLYELF